MITIEQYLMGRDKLFPSLYSEEIKGNCIDTVGRVNKLLSIYFDDTGASVDEVTSGLRPPEINDNTSNSAKGTSKHITGQAVDLRDPDGDLDLWCMNHLQVLAECGLWQEHPAATDSWCHLQTRKNLYLPENCRVFPLPRMAAYMVKIYGDKPLYWPEKIGEE